VRGCPLAQPAAVPATKQPGCSFGFHKGRGPAGCRCPRIRSSGGVRASQALWALEQLRPQTHHPDQPAASGSHRFPNTLSQVGEQYGLSTAPFARARCQLLPLLRPHSPGGAARGSHTGQFSCFGPRSCFYRPASILNTPSGFWPLDRAVGGRAYVRETVRCWEGLWPICTMHYALRTTWHYVAETVAIRYLYLIDYQTPTPTPTPSAKRRQAYG
jgi:hypothetical protein